MSPLRGYGYAAPTLRICHPYGVMDMPPLRYGYGTPTGLRICHPYGVMDMPPLRYGYDTPTGLWTGGVMEWRKFKDITRSCN
ncbi:hypothetical protein ACFSQ0_02425 [Mesonia sediminis]|uniref:Uncharacterized protein n=1 Tax=Mesonia sediminis TaxID=1703946 RepID=A0ABW5SAJ9_9FLAO